jgi:hypothetical protein
VAHGQDGMDDCRIIRVARHIADEGAVDLELLEGVALQIGERRIAGAKVIQRKADADIL